MTMPTPPMAYSGSGWAKGIAAQVSLPSMSTSRPFRRRTPGRTRARPFGTRNRLVDDALEQVGLHRAIGHRRHGFARLCQLRVTGIVEGGAGAAHLRDPGIEVAARDRLGDKRHL